MKVSITAEIYKSMYFFTMPSHLREPQKNNIVFIIKLLKSLGSMQNQKKVYRAVLARRDFPI